MTSTLGCGVSGSSMHNIFFININLEDYKLSSDYVFLNKRLWHPHKSPEILFWFLGGIPGFSVASTRPPGCIQKNETFLFLKSFTKWICLLENLIIHMHFSIYSYFRHSLSFTHKDCYHYSQHHGMGSSVYCKNHAQTGNIFSKRKHTKAQWVKDIGAFI